MKFNNIKLFAIAILTSVIALNCSNDDDNNGSVQMGPDFTGTYVQQDQMGRPAINTVFVSSGMKDAFNTTIPSQQNTMFQSMFETNLTGLSPAYANPGDANALGLDAPTFTGLLATDVLNVSLDGPTSFYDPSTTPATVLTGRRLTDDVITVELLLIFGGEDFTENPGLSNDNVDANDKAFSSSFPYLANPW
ncbi:DUF4331 family protein [Ichthyenterobacterium magnum]|uniref:Uncharacterized protein DUF4331 n=1 Tax=Ichthyenterobacterium magnum TaxID=1230530 RepID=A0A420DKL8_9FLAO|nr:DUF4331 family protein [Ichthyenterobacterium magnum]RKE94793.1 uncharacterized protein DUF4331 [Ichthyenterobacterium magnum]